MSLQARMREKLMLALNPTRLDVVNEFAPARGAQLLAGNR